MVPRRAATCTCVCVHCTRQPASSSRQCRLQATARTIHLKARKKARLAGSTPYASRNGSASAPTAVTTIESFRFCCGRAAGAGTCHGMRRAPGAGGAWCGRARAVQCHSVHACSFVHAAQCTHAHARRATAGAGGWLSAAAARACTPPNPGAAPAACAHCCCYCCCCWLAGWLAAALSVLVGAGAMVARRAAHAHARTCGRALRPCCTPAPPAHQDGVVEGGAEEQGAQGGNFGDLPAPLVLAWHPIGRCGRSRRSSSSGHTPQGLRAPACARTMQTDSGEFVLPNARRCALAIAAAPQHAPCAQKRCCDATGEAACVPCCRGRCVRCCCWCCAPPCCRCGSQCCCCLPGSSRGVGALCARLRAEVLQPLLQRLPRSMAPLPGAS